MSDLYKEVATEMKVKIPDDDMKPFSLTLDKTIFDPMKIGEYLKAVKR
jgi:nitrate/nitrite transport system substrate-binding protein